MHYLIPCINYIRILIKILGAWAYLDGVEHGIITHASELNLINLRYLQVPGLTSTVSNMELKLKKSLLDLKRMLMDIGRQKSEL